MSSTEQLRSDLLQIRTFTSNTIVQIENLLRLKSDGVEGWAGACSKIIGGTTMEHYAGIDVSVESACRRRGYNMPAQNAA